MTDALEQELVLCTNPLRISRLLEVTIQPLQEYKEKIDPFIETILLLQLKNF